MPEKKRRNRGEGSTYQRPNGTWSGQVELPWGPSGRRRKTVYGRTQTEVVRKMTELRRQLTEHGDLDTADITVARWLTYWLDDIASQRVKPNTLRSYRTGVNEHLIPAIGRLRLGKLNAHHLTAMHRALTDRGLSSTTAHNAHRILSAALNDAVRYGRVTRNVAGIIPAPAKAVSRRTGLTAEQAVRVLQASGEVDPRLWSRWLVAFLLGVRQGERLALRWQHVDLDAGTADLAWGLQRVSYAHGCRGTCGRTRAASCPKRVAQVAAGIEHIPLKGNLELLRPKTKGSIRVIPLPPVVVAALRERLRAVEAERSGYTVDHDLVWCREDGSPLDLRTDWQAWRDLLVTAKVPHVTGHDARHSTVTLLDGMGVDPQVIAQIVGHSSVLTQLIYRHADLSRPLAAVTGLSDRLALTPSDAP